MFDNKHHRYIHKILANINSDFFHKIAARFGGGTLITLTHNEYRWSKDIDFVCDLKGYGELRRAILGNGYDTIFSSTDGIELPKDIVADQYGVRFPVKVDGQLVLFEIFLESRIELGKPVTPDWINLPCLNLVDCYAEKLLANGDRWADTSIEFRDLIDLCMMRAKDSVPQEAIDKTEASMPVIEPLKRAILYFQSHPETRIRCYESLQIADPRIVIDGLNLLAGDLDLSETDRTIDEARPEDNVALKN